MGDYKPVKGDRVRVLLEGTIDEVETDGSFGVAPDGTDRQSLDGNFITPSEGHVVSVEKIEPGAVLPEGMTLTEDGSLLNWLGENYVRQPVVEAVVTFKPGDVVRNRRDSDEILVVTEKGHVYLGGPVGGTLGRHYSFNSNITSQDYELVELK